MKTRCKIKYVAIIWLMLLSSIASLKADDIKILGTEIKVTKTKGTTYELLKHISEQSGYLFIYDSRIIDNDKTVRIRKGKYPLREAIYLATGNRDLSVNIIDKHILLKLNENKPTHSPATPVVQTDSSSYFTISGTLYDRISEEPVIYAAISINGANIGTVSNRNGEFQLTLPDSLRKSTIRFSHLGYLNQELSTELLEGQHIRLSLDPRIVSLQEIVVSVVDPQETLRKMEERKDRNYSSQPVYHTVFYREGTDYKNKNIQLTESVIEVYKTGYRNNIDKDQTKLIKMRRITHRQGADTLFTKIKAGLYSCLSLDIIKNTPDFLENTRANHYQYIHSDIDIINNRKVNVISFKQSPGNEEPLFKGDLYIDAENDALTEARFEIDPKHVGKTTDWYLERVATGLKLTIEKVAYIVSYRQADDGKYYINHIRGDLQFKVKKKGSWSSSPLHFWFEMVNCKTETKDVKGFEKKERLSPHKILSETKYTYDRSFWEHFNIILPEDKLKETILNRLNEVTETVQEKD